MDDLLNKPADQPQPQPDASADLRQHLESVRHLAISLMVLVLIIAGAFDLYLLRQVKYAGAELTMIRPQAEQLISEFQKVRAPLMDNFLKQIIQYGQTHQDFGPILMKYQLKQQPGAPTPASPTSPIPGPGVTPVTPPKK